MRRQADRVLVFLVLVVGAWMAASCAPGTPPPSSTSLRTVVSEATAAPTAPSVATQPTPTPAATPLPPIEPTSTSAFQASVPLPTPTLASAKTPSSYEEIQRISPEELKALIESGADIVVVDNQPEGAYNMGHIPGALNFPWAMEIPQPTNLPKDKLLVLYCACTHEEDAGDVAMQLITKYGYKNILLLQGGWLRWMELGYPVEKGE